MHDVLFFLNQNNYGIYNRTLAKSIGLSAAVLLSELVEKRHYHAMRDELIDDRRYGAGWFYHTIEAITDRLGLSREEQDTAIKKLKKYDLIEINIIGVPGKRHFRLKEDKILELFSISNKDYRMRDSHKVDCVKYTKRDVGNTQSLYKDKEPKKELKKNLKLAPFHDAPKPAEWGHVSSDPSAPPNSPSHWVTARDVPSSGPPDKPPLVAEYAIQVPLREPDKQGDPPMTYIGGPETTYQRAENVTTTESEHKKLVDKFGEEAVKEAYEELSEWKKSASSKQVAKHKSDYYRLRKWVIPDLLDRRAKEAKSYTKANIAPHRQNSKLVTPGDSDPESSNFKRRML